MSPPAPSARRSYYNSDAQKRLRCYVTPSHNPNSADIGPPIWALFTNLFFSIILIKAVFLFELKTSYCYGWAYSTWATEPRSETFDLGVGR
ncbi:hypothetical protein EVAR_4528_1 [Eumeta japonica]|uniref:Uncharacterized protein n=1 Tax=Eumeta variegata TaxID=151549 RepID=A0A4C1SZD7_EUMVA|nr:hypothetical protein EVAR_4528_1 [Eumeta japonica]